MGEIWSALLLKYADTYVSLKQKHQNVTSALSLSYAMAAPVFWTDECFMRREKSAYLQVLGEIAVVNLYQGLFGMHRAGSLLTADGLLHLRAPLGTEMGLMHQGKNKTAH